MCLLTCCIHTIHAMNEKGSKCIMHVYNSCIPNMHIYMHEYTSVHTYIHNICIHINTYMSIYIHRDGPTAMKACGPSPGECLCLWLHMCVYLR
jgi:hypothetical protein